MIRRTVTQAALVAPLLLVASACAAETTIALAVTPPKAPSDKPLADALLPLAENAVASQGGLQLVERKQARQLLAELARTRALAAADQALAVGRLAAADLLVAIKLAPPGDDEAGRHALVRVTEGPTAVVRGVAAVPISPASIEDAADEIARYVALHADDSRPEKPTIAVLPFESIDRFDRVRPLERGLRDLFATALLDRGECRVVQRSGMGQLLAELDLVRAGLTHGGAGLDGAPSRQATYVLRGSVDARLKNDRLRVIVEAELIDATKQITTLNLRRECSRDSIPSTVAELERRVLEPILNGDAEAHRAKPANAVREIDRLFESALRDVLRFRRYAATDAGYNPFRVPGVRKPEGVLATVKADTPLGRHLLRKSIDRLESVLFVDPDRLTAALPLAYCQSFHVDGVWNPESCEKLLRRILAESADKEMIKRATELLGDMYFRHQGMIQSNTIDEAPADRLQLGFHRRLEAYAMAPTQISLRIMSTLSKYFLEDRQIGELLTVLERAAEEAPIEHYKPLVKKSFALKATRVLSAVARSKRASRATKDRAKAILLEWARRGDRWRRLEASTALLSLDKNAFTDPEYEAQLNEVFAGVEEPYLQKAETGYKSRFARRLLAKDDEAGALRVLTSFRPVNFTKRFGYDFDYRAYGYQLGQAYERLGREREALETYLHYAELPSGYGGGDDFTTRIDALGGVPLREDRDLDVRYVDSAGAPVFSELLATNGRRLFLAPRRRAARLDGKWLWTHPSASLIAHDPRTGEWTDLGGPDDRIACLAAVGDALWVGTENQGLWRCALAEGVWRQWSTAEGLPTNSVVSVEAHGGMVYAGVAKLNKRNVVSGGVVRVDPGAERVEVYHRPLAPQTAPQRMAIHNDQLIASGLNNQLHALNLKTNEWRRLEGPRPQLVAAGASGVWATPRGSIATLLTDDGKKTRDYAAETRLKDYPRGKYRPRFLVEQDGRLWIGGRPWRKFGDNGLFRLDLETGEFVRYGPRDGFRYDDRNQYECFAGVWLDDELWLATSFGLAVVTPRNLDRADQAEVKNVGGSE